MVFRILPLIFTVILTSPVHGEEDLTAARHKAEALEQQDTDILQRHQPFYFAYGHETSKLQLSFKTPLVRTWQLYFGYTQQLFWALNHKSKPFQDLTFNPELFYQWELPKAWGPLKSIDFGIFNHNSNGKDGDASRSFNKSYVRLNFERELHNWIARFFVQVQDSYAFDDGNAGLQKYVGPVMVNLSFIQLFDSWIDKTEISLQAVPGGKFADRWDYGGYQLSCSFRLGKIRLVPAFYLQYYRGFAETLVNFDQRVDVFRAGIIF